MPKFKMTTRRKKIAEHLLESQHATAHLTTFNEIDMSAVNALRERHKERIEKETGVSGKAGNLQGRKIDGGNIQVRP